MKKVIEKGYTLTVTSWENDADNYRTETKTVVTREEAEQLHKICTELFKSKNRGEGGVGNSMDGDCGEIVLNYYESNKDLLTFEPFINLQKRIDDYPDEVEELIFDCFQDLAYELMGGSEYYDFRVCESCDVTYSPEDIFLEEIKF